ncbi:MAG: SDR family oxidoreductase [Pseudonocardiaceae bacterium]
MIEPTDVAEAVVYLAGTTSRWVTGAVLPVDQGSAVRRT